MARLHAAIIGASGYAGGELLRLIEQGQARDSREARQREAAFAQARNQQQSLLNQARAERTVASMAACFNLSSRFNAR